MAWIRSNKKGSGSSNPIVGIQCVVSRTYGTDIYKDMLKMTATDMGTLIITVNGVTDCGSNDAYIALIKNNVEQERKMLITDISNTLEFQLSVVVNDVIVVRYGWTGNHTAQFDGSCVIA